MGKDRRNDGFLEIEKVKGREIIDSRGNPTVEAEVHLADGTIARGAAPSGASTGEFEALELRDGDKSRFGGKGVSRAVANINTVINDTLKGMDASDVYAVDRAMIEADGTKINPAWEPTLFWQFPLRAPGRRPALWICLCINSWAGQQATVFRFP